MTGEAKYELPPALRRALDAELDVIMTLIHKELPEETTSSAEKIVVNSLRGRGGEAIRKMLDLHVTKRILNVGTNLAVRIFGSPKLPSKAAMKDFLAQFGVLTLKKSERSRMLVATLPDYKQYDSVVALGNFSLDGTTVSIRPFQVAMTRAPARAKGKARWGAGGGAGGGRPRLDEAIVLDEVRGSDGDIRMDDLEDY